ncbi:MAG TPA: hypothetical protein PKE62_10040 [Anaerolineales bacterium]|nr:hypothetical protein [Anaerolineales bacterium]
MKYLPFEDFEIQTALTSNEVFYRLRAAVDTERKWLIFSNKPFWGEVSRHYFKIWKTQWWRRDNPIVTGAIIPNELGCRISVNVRLPWITFWLWWLFLGFIWVAFFIAPAEWLVLKIQTGIWQVESPGGYLISLALFTFFYLFSANVFRKDVRNIKDHFLWISQANEQNIMNKGQIWGMTETQIIKAFFVIPLIIALGWIVFKLVK